MSKPVEKTVAAALGAAVVGSLLAVGGANASSNPFMANDAGHDPMHMTSTEASCSAKTGTMSGKRASQTGNSMTSGNKATAASGHCAVSKKQAAEGMCGSSK